MLGQRSDSVEVGSGPLAMTVVAALLVLAACLVPIERRPEVRAASAAQEQFSAERALELLQRLIADTGPRPAGSAAHARVRERLIAELRGLGLEVDVQEMLARGPGGRIALVRNVVARCGAPNGPAVLLAAHYDSVGASSGAADDGAGVAAMLEIARALRAVPLQHSAILLFSDGEELGLIGAAAFAGEHRWRDDVRVVINLEARGTTGPSLMFQTTGPTSALVPPLSRAAVAPLASSLSDLIYKFMPHDTDLSVFGARGTPGYNFAFIGGLSRYHTSRDDLAHLDARSVQHHGEQALALLRELDGGALEHLTGGDAVYFDVLGLAIVRFGPELGWTLSAAALALALWATRRALRGGSMDLLDLARPLWTAGVAFALALLLPWAGCALLAAWHGVPDPGAASPWTLRIACAGCALASFCAAAAIVGRGRAVFEGAWIAGLCVCAAGALLSTALVPRASHLALVPALAWCALEFRLCPARASRSTRAAAVLALTAVQTLMWAPLAQATELGFGFRLAPMVAAPMAFALLALWPALVSAARASLRRTAVLGGAVAGVSLAVNACLPGATTDEPAWLNLRYVLDGDSGNARIEASTFGAELPEAVEALAAFAPARTPPFPWLSLDPSMQVAPAPVWDVPLPSLDVLGTTQVGALRSVRARLRSPRGATRLHLHVEPRIAIRSVLCDGRSIDTGFEGVTTQLFFAVPPDGVDVEFEIDGRAPARVHVLDQDWTLPQSMRPLVEARPAERTPRADGDVSVLGRSFEL